MSITLPGSVLILGAGVSEPFGMPLGGSLVELLADQIDLETEHAAPRRSRQIDSGTVVHWTRPREWHRHPVYGTLVRSKMNRGGGLLSNDADDILRNLKSLRELLRNQTAETIDSFIAENPTHAALTKQLLAAMMLRASYDSPDEHGLLIARPFASRVVSCGHRDKRFPQSERNWIHLLINIIRHAIDEERITPDNKIKIISFNYDTILESVLESQFSNREAPLKRFSEYVEILHVHGQLGKIEAECADPGATATAWADGICVVKEKEPCDAVVGARDRAAELISEAKIVYAIGFAFAGPNCRMLGLHKPNKYGRRLIYCNYDGNRGIKEASKNYASAPEEIAGEWARPLSVSDFIRAGYLGEPPS